MTPHTPGPWFEVGPHADGSNTVVSDHGKIVCALMPHESDNGQLIAAAPEMLQMLKAVRQVYALQAARDRAEPGMLAGWRKLQDEIDALIAKAEDDA